MQAAFFNDVLHSFAKHGHLGGRVASGHGQVTATVTTTVLRGQPPTDTFAWATDLTVYRDEAIAALAELT